MIQSLLSAGALRLKKVFIIVICSIVATLVLGELYVRFFSSFGYVTVETLRNKSLRFEPALFARTLFPESGIVAPGIDVGDIWKINHEGYRGSDFSLEKKAGTVRIIIYGGSSVFDLAASDGEDWPHLVEKKLTDAGLNVEVINAGIPSHASSDAVGRLFAEGHLLKPDYVLLYDEWNDIKSFHSDTALIRQVKPYEESNNPILIYHGFLDHWLSSVSQLYVRLRNSYFAAHLQLSTEGQIPQIPFSDTISDSASAQYRLNMQSFIDIARNINAIPILITEPRLVSADNTPGETAKINYDLVKFHHDGLLHAFTLTDDIIKQVAQEKKVLVIDANAQMNGKDDYFRDHIHTTERGSQKISEIVAGALQELLSKK